MTIRYETAPLEGVTTVVFRRIHSEYFGGSDRYFMPFFSPVSEHIMTNRDRRELDPVRNRGIRVVPQIMTRRSSDFLWAAEQLAELGYPEVNLNLGCPSRTVTAKGKGSGFLARPEELDRFFEEVFSAVKIPVSVKTRLGIRDPEEFTALLEIFNRYPLASLVIHPRVQQEFYRGAVHRDVFAWAQAHSRNPLCYNGDLLTPADVRALQEAFPAVEAVMVGRGVAADPALLRKLRGGAGASREELRAYTQALFRGYCEAFGQAGPAAQRMKELWLYLIHLFEGGEPYSKKMRRVRQSDEYQRLEAEIFEALPLRESAQGAFE